MGGDAASLAAEMTPYVSAAVGAYGGAVLAKVRDDAADATVGLGRRLLQRVFGSRGPGEPLPGPLADLAADPRDADALAAVRLLVRKALAADPVLATEVRSMLTGAPGVTQLMRFGSHAAFLPVKGCHPGWKQQGADKTARYMLSWTNASGSVPENAGSSAVSPV